MHGKKKDVLRQIQEVFCLIQFIVSSIPRSAPQRAQKPVFLYSLDKETFVTGKRQSR